MRLYFFLQLFVIVAVSCTPYFCLFACLLLLLSFSSTPFFSPFLYFIYFQRFNKVLKKTNIVLSSFLCSVSKEHGKFIHYKFKMASFSCSIAIWPDITNISVNPHQLAECLISLPHFFTLIQSVCLLFFLPIYLPFSSCPTLIPLISSSPFFASIL